MKPLNSVNCNRDLGKPKNWTPEMGECESLPIMDYHDEQHNDWMVSFWSPSVEELAQLNAGQAITLGIFGKANHPVVFVGVSTTQIPTLYDDTLHTDKP